MKAVSGVDELGKPRHGTFRGLFNDGKVACEGEFEHGKKTGRWSYFLANGNLKAVGSYQDDLIVGHWRWYRKNGELMQTGSFSPDGEKHGRWCRYHPNGKLMDEGEFERGKKTGVWASYDHLGNKKDRKKSV
jgi:antitoxin component YwqK of YwqJK toxin-antitoxin module